MLFAVCLSGSEAVFYPWKRHVNPEIEIYPVQLKGRENDLMSLFTRIWKRRFKTFLNRFKALSMAVTMLFLEGSLLAYELYYKMAEADSTKLSTYVFLGL
ncbi:hypothetical protein QKW52_19915 [Bacillus sonorensis]|nr:hypothetical protein [Bacillus sonorensis]